MPRKAKIAELEKHKMLRKVLVLLAVIVKKPIYTLQEKELTTLLK